MRLKKVKNAEIILKDSNYVTKDVKFDNNNNPIYIEIGMGKGKFIVQNALENPNINFVGIEKFDSVLARACQRIGELEIPNLKLVRIDALDLDQIFDHQVDRIYLNFSDPWPKKRHQNRRLTSRVFLEKYKKICNNNEIYLKTDNKNLFDYSVESLEAYGYIIDYDTFNPITTEYEDKFMVKGYPIYKLHATLHKN